MWTVVFFLLGLAGVVGLGIGVCIGLPLFLYVLPYSMWLGWNGGRNGVPVKCESDSLSGFPYLKFQAKNATKLYRSWITKTPHGITKF